MKRHKVNEERKEVVDVDVDIERNGINEEKEEKAHVEVNDCNAKRVYCEFWSSPTINGDGGTNSATKIYYLFAGATIFPRSFFFHQ